MARTLTQVTYSGTSLQDVLLLPITNKTQAGMFIRWLVKHGMDFHFDDSPDDLINGRTGLRLFKAAELPLVRARVAELFLHLKDPHDTVIRILKENEHA